MAKRKKKNNNRRKTVHQNNINKQQNNNIIETEEKDKLEKEIESGNINNLEIQEVEIVSDDSVPKEDVKLQEEPENIDEDEKEIEGVSRIIYAVEKDEKEDEVIPQPVEKKKGKKLEYGYKDQSILNGRVSIDTFLEDEKIRKKKKLVTIIGYITAILFIITITYFYSPYTWSEVYQDFNDMLNLEMSNKVEDFK